MGLAETLSERINGRVLKCFGHVERMRSDKLTKRVYTVQCTIEAKSSYPNEKKHATFLTPDMASKTMPC